MLLGLKPIFPNEEISEESKEEEENLCRYTSDHSLFVRMGQMTFDLGPFTCYEITKKQYERFTTSMETMKSDKIGYYDLVLFETDGQQVTFYSENDPKRGVPQFKITLPNSMVLPAFREMINKLNSY
jgi:hypothetical protein